MMTSAALTEFRDAIRDAGLTPPDAVIDDGKLHRFATNGSPHDCAGWYVFHGDGIPAGAFGDWRTGASHSWRSDIGRRLSTAEEAAHRLKMEAIRRTREEGEARRQAEAASKANPMWEEADAASDEHPYLQAKGVKPYGLRTYRGELVIGGMACDDCLIVPMRIGKTLHSLQFIAPNGEKRFLPGGRIKGCYYGIGVAEGLKRHGVLCLAEGVATAASIHEATGYGVIAAFNAGNLEPVAVSMAGLKNEYPQLRFIVCADDDVRTPNNPGITKASEAARAIGGILAIPNFGENRPEGASDFNDLSRCLGKDAVRGCVEGTEEVTELKLEPVAALHVEPVSLDAAMLPALPVDSLPSWFRDMVLAVSEDTETPVELAAMMALAVLGTCCQKTFIVSPTPGYIEPLNIWTVAALDSGNRKTAVMTAITAPLLEWQREQQETARQRIVAAQSDQETTKARIKELRAQAARFEDIADFEKAKKEIQALEQSLGEVPASPRLWAEDVTPERLGQLMAEQGERLSLLSDEGGIFEIMAGRYSAGIPNIDIFLKAHAGSPVCVDRGSRPL
jgi:putative DNA primase/helicase